MNEKKGLLDRLREWWESGYEHDEGYLVEKSAKSRPGLSVKERIHLWWLRGYDDPRLVNAYLERLEKIAEQASSMSEHSKRGRKPLEHISEQGNMNEKVRDRMLETSTQDHVLASQMPSREDLDALKKALNISKGSLCFKLRGRGIYLVRYDQGSKRRVWKHLGPWEDLKRKAELKEKAVNPQPIP